MADRTGLRACFINCSLKPDRAESHTATLVGRIGAVMEAEGVEVDVIHAREHTIAFGMAKDLSDQTTDEWPDLQQRVLAADILVIATPIWLGVRSSVASLVIERLYAHSSDHNDRGQFVYYGKVGGCVVTGNEDGIKAVAMDTLYALQHIGYTIPPQADCGWIGEAGPGPSYGDEIDDARLPVGFDNEFTDRNATIMAWNLMHAAALLRDAGGWPAVGNTADGWREVSHVGVD